ncbi:alpha/beta hydrolase [Acinetobacter sp. A47]|uniref:alpha/beta hydrolase n=1 Tax=Acinetobacter sp. A47 TaxID=1561217 RepID=UPI000571DA92|nr:alpha/beta hydrolase [Acinetobacter sp. A47]
MSFDFEKVTYTDSNFTVYVKKNLGSDFAFYILRGNKRLAAKSYTKNTSSSIDVVLDRNKVYCLKLFNRPECENTTLEKDKITLKRFFYLDKYGRIFVIKEELLYEDGKIKITEYDQDSNITFVTFNSSQTNKTTSPFGAEFLLSNGWNLIALHKHDKNQYQDLNIELFERIVKPRTKDKKTYIYGTSLGGYCACYFGGVIDATIIAGAPKLLVHPSIRHPDYKEIEYKHVPIDKVPKTTKPVFIIFDPLDNGDVRFIKDIILKAYPLPYLVPVKHGTHLVIKTLITHNLLKDTIMDLVEHNYLDVIKRIHQYNGLG